MKVKVLFLILMISAFFSIQLNGLTIEIEPNEINQVSEILQAFINNQSLQPYQPQRRSSIRSVIIPLLKAYLAWLSFII